jgi:hypothetical protein
MHVSVSGLDLISCMLDSCCQNRAAKAPIQLSYIVV